MHWSFYGGYRYLKTAIKAPSDSNFSSSLHCFQTLTLPVTLLSASVNTHLQSVPWEPGHTTSNAVATALGMVNVACRFPLPGPPAGAQWRLHCQWVWSHDLYWPMVCVACHSQNIRACDSLVFFPYCRGTYVEMMGVKETVLIAESLEGKLPQRTAHTCNKLCMGKK